MRAASQYRMDRLAADDGGAPDGGPSLGDVESGWHVGRMEHRESWADEVMRQAIARGEFDHLALAGKPIPGLTRHDPDWWLKAYIEREHITGVGPEAFLLRQADAELDARLDREYREADVRDILDEFNHRVIEARRQLFGGPPVVTPTRDVEAEVERWRERRAAMAAAAAAEGAPRQRSASWYRGQFLSRRRASSPAAPSDGLSGVTDLP
jgi:hypothetical protein